MYTRHSQLPAETKTWQQQHEENKLSHYQKVTQPQEGIRKTSQFIYYIDLTGDYYAQSQPTYVA